MLENKRDLNLKMDSNLLSFDGSEKQCGWFVPL